MKLKYLTSYLNRHGKRYYRFQHGETKIPMGCDPSSPTFMVKYNALKAAAENGSIGVAAAVALPGSIADVILQYKACTINTEHFRGFLSLAYTSQVNYRRTLDTIQRKIGFDPLKDLTADAVRSFRNMLTKEKFAVTRIDECLMLLSVLWTFGSEFYEPLQKLGPNPTTGVLRVKPKSVHHRRWPLHVIARVLEVCNSNAKLAIYLLLYTGQREIEVIKMKWTDIEERQGVRMIHVVQQKTGTKVWIPLHPVLGALLDETPRINAYILNTNRDERFASTSSLSGTIKSALRKSRLNDYSSYTAHGLRASAACELLEAGNEIYLVASITGHKDLKVLQEYLSEINQEKLAMRAMKVWGDNPAS